jgi:hypothetical protein
MDLREIGWDDKDWIYIAVDKVLWGASPNTVMNNLVL